MHRSSSVLEYSFSHEIWPLKRPFVISRGSKVAAEVVVVRIKGDGFTGQGEAVPYGRYGETVKSVIAQLQELTGSEDRRSINSLLAPGAARNALDCAFWDLEAKLTGVSASALAGMGSLSQVMSAFTLSLGSPDEMAQQAVEASRLGLLKLKLGGGLEDEARMRAVRAARPDARLIADANEAWTVDELVQLSLCAQELGFEMIEQPLAAGQDDALSDFSSDIAICADESVHTADDLAGLVSRYKAVNIKLDKAGGLTQALVMVKQAREMGFKIMIGSMVGTSLAVSPALLLAQGADWVDLDGPLLLKEDRPFGLAIKDGFIAPPLSALWG